MDGIEILAVVVFFLIGYWVVDFFWPKRKPPENPPDRNPQNPENKS